MPRAVATAPRGERTRVAVVGSGITGLSAAYHIACYGGNGVDVTLLEKNDVLGGHEMTQETPFGKVDLGYMVMNFECYPNLVRFYREHLIPLEPTAMGFSIQNSRYTWSFGYDHLNAFRLLFNGDFWKFVASKSRFHADGHAFIARPNPPSITLREFCEQNGYDPAFVDGWLQPFCEAVWSSPTSSALEMEAYTILCFLRNHGFLRWDLLQWYTPKGRTTVTIERFHELFAELGVTVRTGAAVAGVSRPTAGADGGEVELRVVTAADGGAAAVSVERFDRVVLATPAGTALEMLGDGADEVDVAALGGFAATTTKIVLHTDPSLMPTERRHWESWNVIEHDDVKDRSVLTYWVRPLQHVRSPNDHLFITLNPPPSAPAAEHVLHERWASHPALSVAATRCQRVVRSRYQGHRGLWHAGAWLHYGFHEDGFRSGIEAARSLLGNDAVPLMPVDWTRQHVRLAGRTSHTRRDAEGNVVHAFGYGIEYDCVDVDAGFRAWWGGLFRTDHFGDPSDTLSEAVRKEVAARTGHWPSGAIDVVTTLREFGAVFNPISVFLVWDSTERNRVEYVVSEVTNTPWGERVVQVLPVSEAMAADASKDPGAVVIVRKKQLHVSPFQPVPDGKAVWRYTMALPTRECKDLKLRVELLEHPKAPHPRVVATMELEDRGAPWVWCRGLVPTAWKTLWRIHAQAFVLMAFKKQPYHANTTQRSEYTFGDNPPFVPNGADVFNGEVWVRTVSVGLLAAGAALAWRVGSGGALSAAAVWR